MKCPVCGNKSYVTKTFFKSDKTIRYRKCSDKTCGKKFETTEMQSYGWNYKNIVKKIKELVREVK